MTRRRPELSKDILRQAPVKGDGDAGQVLDPVVHQARKELRQLLRISGPTHRQPLLELIHVRYQAFETIRLNGARGDVDA